MALSFSQGFRSINAGFELGTLSVANRLALVDGGASNDTVTDSSNGLLTAGFLAGQYLEVIDATNTANRVSVPILVAVAGQLDVPTGTWAAAQAAAGGVTLTIKSVNPQCSYRHLLFNSQMDWYSGSRPAYADDTEQGTLLASFTAIKFGNVAWDSTYKRAYIDLFGATAISCTAAATGTASWFRLRGGQVTTTGSSSTAPRIDGTIGVGSTYDLQVASTTVTSGQTYSISSFKLYLPAVSS